MAQRRREWVQELRQMAERGTLRAAERVFETALAAEKIGNRQDALSGFRCVADVGISGAEEMAAESRKKLLEVRRRMKMRDQAEPEGGTEAQPQEPPHEPENTGGGAF